MVEVFKTNVRKDKEAEPLAKSLTMSFPEHKINFDLQDCDRILRVEGVKISARKIIRILEDKGYKCAVLE